MAETAAAAEQPVTARRLFLTIRVYPTRVEVSDGMWPFRRKTTIPLRNISTVEVTKLTKQLAIHTNDGKAHKYAIGGFGKAQRLKEAILERL